jgi:hypothetical protein
MAGMGPPPKAEGERRRRNATTATTRLPAEGRTKRAPNWPLIPDVVLTARRDIAAGNVQAAEYKLEEAEAEGKPTGLLESKLTRCREALLILERQLAAQRQLEASLWKTLWSTPQSVQWERLGWTRDVAQYVRHKVLGELGELDDAREARQWSDRLGLTPLALLRLRWEVAEDETAAKRQERTAAAAPTSARDRLRIVDSAG